MKPREAASALAAFVLVASTARGGEAGDPELRVPIAGVDRGRAPAADDIAAAADGLGAPVLSGAELAAALRLADTGDPGQPDALRAAHAAATEAFFAGAHGRAAELWVAASDALAARPGLLARDPGLRRVAFEARLYLALAARGARDEAGAERWLAAAAELEELEPDPADFPPWARDRLAALRAGRPAPDGALAFAGGDGCELWVDGVRAGAGPGTFAARRGAHAAQVRCGRSASPIVAVAVTGDAVTIAAPVLRRSTLSTAGGVTLVPEADATDAEVAADLHAVAGAAGADRIAALVGAADGTELWLVDGAGVVRRAPVTADTSAGLADAARRVAAGAPPSTTAPARARPWYRDGPAWGLAAAGLAAWGVGLALGRTYGTPSHQEPAAWALMAGGAAVAGTGVVLFFVPGAPGSGASEPPAVGAAAAFRF